MSHHNDVYCNFGPPYSFANYAPKSKLYFLLNAMMMIFFSLVKIIATHTHTHTYTHTRIYKRKQTKICPVAWGCRIHRLLLCRGVRPSPTSVLDMTLNNLMVRFQQRWSFGECRVPLYCYCSQIHSSPERLHLIGPYLWVK